MPMYINFEGGVRAKKALFLVEIFPKVPKNELYSGLGELRKSVWSTLKKVDKFFNFFLENPFPPSRNS